MTIRIVAVESLALSSTCRTAGLVSAFQTRLIAASSSGQYARALGGQRCTAAGAGRTTTAVPSGARATAGANAFGAGVASSGLAGVGGGNVLSRFLISSLVRGGADGDWTGERGLVTGGVARASSAFLNASATSREGRDFGDKGSVGAVVAGWGRLFDIGRTGATSLGTVISWSRFCNNATWGDGVVFATVAGGGTAFGGAGGGGVGFGSGTGACST